MILINNFIEDAIRKIKRLEIGQCLDARTHKRDRGVLIEKTESGWNVYEDGFYKEEHKELMINEVEKVLKVIKSREFPRSRVVYFYTLNSKEEARRGRR